MRNATLEKLAWVLIYGGLLALCLGIFVLREGAATPGWALVVGGGGVVVLGVGAVWWRARRPADGS
jgi:O-antigen/teichoic acid export membrane protein